MYWYFYVPFKPGIMKWKFTVTGMKWWHRNPRWSPKSGYNEDSTVAILHTQNSIILIQTTEY